ncbi:serine protease, partial [bacterium]
MKPLASVKIPSTVLAAALLVGGCSYEPPAGIPLSDVNLATLGKSATVLVENRIEVDITMPEMSFDAGRAKTLLDRTVAENPSVGGEEIVNLFLRSLFENLDGYYELSPGEAKTFRSVSHGSGFFVTGDGYLLTNAHVVEQSPEDLQTSYLAERIPTLVQEIRRSFGADSAPVVRWFESEANKKLVVTALLRLVLSGMKSSEPKVSLSVMDPAGEAGTAAKPNLIPARLVPGGTGKGVIGEKDVAVLKAEGSGFYSIPLADESPKVQENVFAVGFPGGADGGGDGRTFDPNERPAATVTEGKVNALKTVKSGDWAAIEISAVIRHGNSGGPLLNGKGEAVGFSTFYEGDATQDAVHYYALPISVGKEFLEKTSVDAQPSGPARRLRHALVYAESGRYRRAESELQTILAERPRDAIAAAELETVRGHLKAGEDPAYRDYVPWAAGAGILVLGAVGFSRRGRRPSAPKALKSAPVATPSQSPAPAPPT